MVKIVWYTFKSHSLAPLARKYQCLYNSVGGDWERKQWRGKDWDKNYIVRPNGREQNAWNKIFWKLKYWERRDQGIK